MLNGRSAYAKKDIELSPCDLIQAQWELDGRAGGTEIEGSGIQGHCLYGLGADYNGSFMCTCHIAEFIVYNTGLKDHEREAVEKYLSEKYGIALTD